MSQRKEVEMVLRAGFPRPGERIGLQLLMPRRSLDTLRDNLCCILCYIYRQS